LKESAPAKRQGHRDLIAWQKGMALVNAIYRETRNFPDDEKFGLTNQLRRAAVSIPSNIAEGHGRMSRRELHQFLAIARGSSLEVQTQIEIAESLGYFRAGVGVELLNRTIEISRVLNGLLAWSK
jgi:four helix bundle protein